MVEFRAAAIDWMDNVSILVCQRDYSRNQIAYIAKPVEFIMERHDPGSFISQGTMTFSREEVVQLMNALWNAGLRPTDFKNPSGEINRMESHLADMRRLVFKDGATSTSSHKSESEKP